MITTSYNRIFEVVELLNKAQVPDEKFQYAVVKNAPKFNKVFKTYRSEEFDINIDLCKLHEDGEKKGTPVKDEKGNYVYTKENAKARQVAINTLCENESKVSFDNYFAPLSLELAEQLGFGALEVLAGIVFRTEDVESITITRVPKEEGSNE